MPLTDSARLTRTATRWGVSIGAVAYFAVLFDFRLDATRTAVRQGFASNFFELQAEAFLHGRLYVPTGSLGIEGFVVHGRTYEYFPPYPALLRIPIMLITHEFDGRLSLVSMAAAWIVYAIMATKLFWLVRECLRDGAPVGRTEAVVAALVLAAVTGGTVLVFDASLPWVYHEVYLWATALAVGALYWLVRASLDPTRKALCWLGAFNLGTVLTRTTGGFAVCAACIGVAAWVLTGRPHPGRRRVGWAIAAMGVVPLAVSITYNMVKFAHPYLFPLQDEVWTSVNAHRREALRRNGGTIAGPQFLLTGVVNYLRPNGIRFTEYFPWITLPASPAKAHGGAFLDQSYRTGSVPAFMPMLTVTCLWGLARTYLRRRAPLGTRVLRIPLLGALLIPLGVLDYGYLTYRYASDFVPVLALGAMIGGTDLARLLPRLRLRLRVPALAMLAALTAFSVLANILTGYSTAQQTWGGQELVQYVALQRTLGGTDGLVSHSRRLPASGRTDDLHIVGDCAGLYLASGDQYEPWLTVETRPVRIRVVIGRLHPGVLRLLTVAGVTDRAVNLQINTRRQLRFVVTGAPAAVAGGWIATQAGEEIDVTLDARTDYDAIAVSALPGGLVGWVPLVQYDRSWQAHIASVIATLPSTARQRASGVRLAVGATAAPSLCEHLAHDAHIALGD